MTSKPDSPMAKYTIPGTARTPDIDFDFSANHLVIRGESYPEDAISFYAPIIEKLEEYLIKLDKGSVSFQFAFIYFNSSSARAIMNMLRRLDEAARAGASVRITWQYDEEDDSMQEMGEEFGEDIESAVFELEVFNN